MILTATLNAALDLTYRVDRLVPHSTHRVRHVHAMPGGKGLNVARVLVAMGEDVVATGLVGGVTGEQIRSGLTRAAVPDALVGISAESRRTVTVYGVDDADATVFSEPGPVVDPHEWTHFTERYGELLAAARVAVLCGSLPPGVPEDAYRVLVEAAHRRRVPVIVDTSGPALRASLQAGPEVVKPNASELREVTGLDDPLPAARQLRAAGARAVVASLGPAGLLVLDEHECLQARPPEDVHGNATGAGDACVAAVAAGLARGDSWPQILPRAVALSAAAVPMPHAGEVDLDRAARFLDAVTLEAADAPGAHR